MEIAGRSFVVTGGASGLGAATVRALVAAGGTVVIADRNRDVGEALAAELCAATAAGFVAGAAGLCWALLPDFGAIDSGGGERTGRLLG